MSDAEKLELVRICGRDWRNCPEMERWFGRCFTSAKAAEAMQP